jgi:magnesium chelatase family protein
MAAAVLRAAGEFPGEALDGTVVLGELALDGRVRAVRGVLPAVLAAARTGICRAVVPAPNVAEARLVTDARVVGVGSLAELAGFLKGDVPAETDEPAVDSPSAEPPPPDLADVLGQDLGRRALEVVAAGGHHLAMFGPPGSGKTMLAERLPGVLPGLGLDAALEVTGVHSVAGALPSGAPLIRRPPYQAPHHTASVAALVGGGPRVARPGAVSLAHHGVLFLDEAPEFPSGALDALRQPLENGEVVLARAGGIATYPARIQLVIAANPCPCSSAAGADGCQCSPITLRRYLRRISGPLLDRIDLRVTLLPVRLAALMDDASGTETSAAVAERVARARAAARERWRTGGWQTNAEVPGRVLRSTHRLPRTTRAVLDRALDTGQVSARGYDRALRVAWSLADLAGRVLPDGDDLAEATDLRLGTAA